MNFQTSDTLTIIIIFLSIIAWLFPFFGNIYKIKDLEKKIDKLQDDVEKIEESIHSVTITVAELKTEINYLKDLRHFLEEFIKVYK